MPASAPAALLRVVLKLIAIGFAGLFMGFALTPETWNHHDSSPPRYSEVEALRTFVADVPTAIPMPIDNSPRTTIALDVHIGPGVNYQIIGSVPRGAKLDVIGRDASSQWLAVAFAGGTKLNGWVPVQSVAGIKDLKSLSLAPVTLLP